MGGISVIIPVCGLPEYTGAVLEDIANQTLAPKEILIVDNSRDPYTMGMIPKFRETLPQLRLYYSSNSFGVNASWNFGFNMVSGNLVSVLNNDLRLPKHFLEAIQHVFKSDSTIGIVVPNTVDSIRKVETATKQSIRIQDLSMREGWAFTIRRQILQQIGEIPSELKSFCGDDWIFQKAWAARHRAVKILSLPIYHYVSRTVETEGKLPDMKVDCDTWERNIGPTALRWRKAPGALYNRKA